MYKFEQAGWSAARELRVNEHSAAVEGVGVFPDVRLLVIVLSLPHPVHQLRLMGRLGAAVGGLGEVLSEALVTVLLGLPYGGALLRRDLEDIRTAKCFNEQMLLTRGPQERGCLPAGLCGGFAETSSSSLGRRCSMSGSPARRGTCSGL